MDTSSAGHAYAVHVGSQFFSGRGSSRSLSTMPHIPAPARTVSTIVDICRRKVVDMAGSHKMRASCGLDGNIPNVVCRVGTIKYPDHVQNHPEKKDGFLAGGEAICTTCWSIFRIIVSTSPHVGEREWRGKVNELIVPRLMMFTEWEELHFGYRQSHVCGWELARARKTPLMTGAGI